MPNNAIINLVSHKPIIEIHRIAKQKLWLDMVVVDGSSIIQCGNFFFANKLNDDLLVLLR